MDNCLNIISIHVEPSFDAKRIVERIIRYAPKPATDGLCEIVLLNTNEEENCFACYRRKEKRIELYLGDIIGWLPWILKKTYVIPYLFIGIALGHEFDHHVNRTKDNFDRENSAEHNTLKYIYPSLGIFKPFARIVSYFCPKPILANKRLQTDARTTARR
jgi:hypothetical protein